MNLWQRIFGRPKSDQGGPLPVGRFTQNRCAGALSPLRSRTTDILRTFRKYPDDASALDFLKRVHPDVSMAVWNFLRLANQGHELRIYAVRENRRLSRVEKAWREFASRVNAISNSGLDGLIDILHQSAFMRGAQAVEVEVNEDRTDIVDVYPVIPQTIEWAYEERGNRKEWIPYQYQPNKKQSLAAANFFWVPMDPDIEDPRGNLVLAPALQAIDFQLQILQDLQQVIHNQGWPRYDVKVILERVMASTPAQVKANAKELRQYLADRLQEIKTVFDALEPDDSFIHYDDTEIGLGEGASTRGRGLDVRAITEMLDTEVMSGTKQLSVFMNRNTGVTETWGTVQFRIFASGLASVQRGSKRLVESIARLWLRVHGIQGIPKFEHNTIDWNSEEQRQNVQLLKQRFWAIAQLMGWVSGDRACQEVVGDERAVTETPEEIKEIPKPKNPNPNPHPNPSLHTAGGGDGFGDQFGSGNGAKASPIETTAITGNGRRG